VSDLVSSGKLLSHFANFTHLPSQIFHSPSQPNFSLTFPAKLSLTFSAKLSLTFQAKFFTHLPSQIFHPPSQPNLSLTFSAKFFTHLPSQIFHSPSQPNFSLTFSAKLSLTSLGLITNPCNIILSSSLSLVSVFSVSFSL
jgi:hypothetical protein